MLVSLLRLLFIAACVEAHHPHDRVEALAASAEGRNLWLISRWRLYRSHDRVCVHTRSSRSPLLPRAARRHADMRRHNSTRRHAARLPVARASLAGRDLGQRARAGAATAHLPSRRQRGALALAAL